MAKRTLFLPESKSPYALSRTKLDDFLTCRRCFYLDRRLGIVKPGLPAFALNIAVDALLKKEFDLCRVKVVPHRIMIEHGLDAVPFQHPDLGVWRNNFKGVRFLHSESNLILYGAVDDLWQFRDGSLAVVDYKATATTGAITLETPYRQHYKRQLEVYQFLLRRNGLKVSPRAFILYVNGRTDRDGFNGRLEFRMQLLEHQGDDSWVGPALVEAGKCLAGELPPPTPGCQWCEYREARL